MKSKAIWLICAFLLLVGSIRSTTGNAAPTYQLSFEQHDAEWNAGAHYEVTVCITKTSGAKEPEHLTARWLIDGQVVEGYRNDDFDIWRQTYSSLQQRTDDVILSDTMRNITFELLRDGTPVSWASTSVTIRPNARYYGQPKVTGYTPAASENGGYTVTCRGIPLKNVIGVCAATDSLPIGTKVYIEGIGRRTIMDKGCGNTIDVLVSSKWEAWNVVGNRNKKVWIIE